MNGKKILAACAFAFGLFASSLLHAQGQALDKVVAVVDDDVIMASELSLQMNLLAGQIRQAGQELPPPEFLQRQVLEKLIVESLQLQMAERAGIKVTDAQMEQAIANIAAQNRMEPQAFLRELDKQGFPMAMFRENLRRQIIIQQIQQGIVAKRIDISDQDIENFLKSEEGRMLAMRAAEAEPVEQIHSRHILVKISEVRNDEEAAALLQKLRAAALKGGDFAALAKKYSEDPASALKGGDLGWSTPGQLVPEFEQVMASTEPGTVSAPFRTQYGWHIVQVLERRKQDMSEELLQRQAQIILRKRQFQDELPRWLKELRDKAYVQIKI